MPKKTEAASSACPGFEKQLWDAACVLWGSIPAADCRKIIVGLISPRCNSAAFEQTDRRTKL